MNRYASIAIVAALLSLTGASDTCIHCICLQESGCKPIGCNMNGGSLTCGYYQIKLPYYEDCGQPGKNAGEDTEAAWKRCSNDYACVTTCVQNYVKRYSSECGWGKDPCEVMARIHNGGPSGCSNPATSIIGLSLKSVAVVIADAHVVAEKMAYTMEPRKINTLCCERNKKEKDVVYMRIICIRQSSY